MSEPLRMCLGCHSHAAKSELCRIVRTPSGEIRLDAAEKMPGRGAYLCRSTDCVRRVRKSHALERALKASIEPEFYDELATLLGESHG